MLSILYILFGGLFTVATSWSLGTLLLRRISAALGEIEAQLLAFATGSACLRVIVFALCAAGLGRKGVFLGAGLLLDLLAGASRRRQLWRRAWILRVLSVVC